MSARRRRVRLETIMYRVFFKRVFDLFLALAMTLCLLPFLLVVAALGKFSSKGPVLFRQKRGGRGGSWFEILKFRTMRESPDASEGSFDAGDASRVTSVGAFLRKTKLDELPQLANVIRGEMSFVGPRPEVAKYIELYPERWERVLSERPGITDPASVRFRNEEEILAGSSDPEKEYREKILPAKLELYERYVERVSLIGDVKILFATLAVVLFGGSSDPGSE
jgi:lipopolysaccharide/colanic/teichoic acid biosynthesis glycosyltransferase